MKEENPNYIFFKRLQKCSTKQFEFRRGSKPQAVRVYGKAKLTKYKLKFGGVAQLGEHLPCKQGVRSSILLISTSNLKDYRKDQ